MPIAAGPALAVPLAMRNAKLEKLVWVLIYGGLLLACLGMFVQRQHAPWGGALAAGGLAAVLAGLVLMWLRARRPD